MSQYRAEFDYCRSDFEHSPLVVFYETTQACDLVCQHCRACAQPRRDPGELTAAASRQLVDQFAEFPKPPLVVLTGGDPLKRPDIYDLVRHGVGRGLSIAMTPSATPLVTEAALQRLHEAGLRRLAVSLDGADAATHDAFRGVTGSYRRTREILDDAGRIGLPLQVNTTVTLQNWQQIDQLAELLTDVGIVLWSVFFLIPVGRGDQLPRLSPQQYEEVFERLWQQAQRRPFGIKTTEAPHYRRFVLQRKGDPQRAVSQRPSTSPTAGGPSLASPPRQRAPLGVNDGRGVMFVSHRGEIYPSGFLPIPCGRFPDDSVVDVY